MASTSSRPSAQTDSCRIRLHSIVHIVSAIDIDIHDVSPFIGRMGEVLSVGSRDNDPTFSGALIVGFCDGSVEMFWPEELALP